VLLIEGELLNRVRGGLEQSRVTDALVVPHERTQLFWDGKCHQEVMAWELACDLSLEPLLGFTVLAGGTVAITARDKELLRLGTAIAFVKRNPASLRTTGHDGIDDFAMSLGHGASVTLKILRAEGGKDFTDGGHDRVPPLCD
jgi:hypothetical protein